MAISLNTVNSEVVRAHKRIDDLNTSLNISLYKTIPKGGTFTNTEGLFFIVQSSYNASEMNEITILNPNIAGRYKPIGGDYEFFYYNASTKVITNKCPYTLYLYKISVW